MDQFTHGLIRFGVHAGVVNGVALCCMLARAIADKGDPNSDHDQLFEYQRWKADLRILDIEEIMTVL